MGHPKLDPLESLLERTGGDARRLDVVRRAQKFKRTWIELAEGLCRVRADKAYLAWGFDDFYDYCARELRVKRSTVDKLTLSFAAVKKHAPAVLERDGVAAVLPQLDGVEYFARAVEGDGQSPPRDPDLVRELHNAVFDEGEHVASLKRRFNPLLNPRPKVEERLERINQTAAVARKLAELLPDVDGLPEKRVRRLEEELGALRENLEGLAEPLREQVSRGKKWTQRPTEAAA